MLICMILVLGLVSWIWHNKHKQSKEKIDIFDVIKMINIHIKEHCQSEKTSQQMGENIVNPYTDTGLIFRICQELLTS